MSDHDLLVFLVSLATMLAAARLLGEAGRKLGLPLVAGEAAAGVVLGPTLLGRIAPGASAWLFASGPPEAMRLAFATVAAALLLVVTGLEVNLGVARRRGASALPTASFGVLVPAAGGIALGLLLPASDLADPSRRATSALVLGIAFGVSALPVIARTLSDLGLFKSDIGLLVMSAAMIDGVAGWLALAVVLAWAGSFGRALLVACFFAAIALRASRRLRETTRGVVGSFVAIVFAPVFFASIGLRVDWTRAFDLRLCALVLAIAAGAKLAGCVLGARLGGLKWRESAAVGFGMNARGAMGVVLAAIARDAGLVRDEMFVALVVMALVTSVASGPAMKRLLYRAAPEEDVVTLLRRGAFVSELHARTPSDAIAELVRALGSLLTGHKRDARDAVIERELVAATGLGDEVAIPHAAIEGLVRPLLALGRAPHGIDFDAPDGKPARIVFLLLIPPRAYEEEVRILASIARATFDAQAREDLLAATGLDEATRVLAKSAKRTRESRRPPRAEVTPEV